MDRDGRGLLGLKSWFYAALGLLTGALFLQMQMNGTVPGLVLWGAGAVPGFMLAALTIKL